MNRNCPAPKPAENISDSLQQCVGPKWEKPSHKIRINKGLATNNLDAIMLKSTINGRLANS